MSRRTLAQATRIICGDDGAGMKDPQGWVKRQIRKGRFGGMLIGRNWFMDDDEIKSAIETCRRVAQHPVESTSPVEAAPAAAPSSIVDGLTERARRRLRRSA